MMNILSLLYKYVYDFFFFFRYSYSFNLRPYHMKLFFSLVYSWWRRNKIKYSHCENVKSEKNRRKTISNLTFVTQLSLYWNCTFPLMVVPRKKYLHWTRKLDLLEKIAFIVHEWFPTTKKTTKWKIKLISAVHL